MSQFHGPQEYQESEVLVRIVGELVDKGRGGRGHFGDSPERSAEALKVSLSRVEVSWQSMSQLMERRSSCFETSEATAGGKLRGEQRDSGDGHLLAGA